VCADCGLEAKRGILLKGRRGEQDLYICPNCAHANSPPRAD